MRAPEHVRSPGPNSLLFLEKPGLFLQRALKVYPEEVKLLVWVTLIQLVMRVSSILLNNVAQTTFLKRFGVEALPVIFLSEAVITLFFAAFVGVVMEKFGTVRVFTALFLFFALAIAAIRVLTRFDWPILYPVLYILKSQAVEILPILYWDILSDLFTTQQSKRLYTLITAGGVLGTTIGSFMTGRVAAWVGTDNVLLVFTGGMCLAAVLNALTEKVVGAPINPQPTRKKGKVKQKFRETARLVAEQAKRSPLLTYMIIITAIPNILLPIMTYQFNVAVDSYYATEQGTLAFFGIFRGVSNALMFVLLLFSGRLISQWGVPTSLLFHPINYLIGFGALFLRFDIFSAVYARFSAETLKTVLNNPARAILFNFFPEDFRGLIRVFLRGTVVRVSDFAGSGFLILVRGLMDPRLLSLVAAPLTAIWIATSFLLKRRYAAILTATLKEKQVDWQRLEAVDFSAWVKDKKALESLYAGLADGDPGTVVGCAEILARTHPPGWGERVIRALPGKPPETQRALLGLLIKEDLTPSSVPELMAVTQGASPASLAPLLAALSRLAPEGALPVFENAVRHADPRVRVEAIAGLYLSRAPGAMPLFRSKVERLTAGGRDENLLALGILERTGAPEFTGHLVAWSQGGDPSFQAPALRALGRMGHRGSLDTALRALSSPAESVRRAAVDVMLRYAAEVPPGTWFGLLGAPDPVLRQAASRVLETIGAPAVRTLLPLLASPQRIVRTEVLSLLERMGVPAVELSHFVMGALGGVYENMALLASLPPAETGEGLKLLRDALLQKNNEILEMTLRVLGMMGSAEMLKTVLKAVQTGGKRDRDMAIEVLEGSLHPRLRKALNPLLDEKPPAEKLEIGRRLFEARAGFVAPPEAAFRLMGTDDPLLRALTLYAVGEGSLQAEERRVSELLGDPEKTVREAAAFAARRVGQAPGLPLVSDAGPTLVEKIGMHARVAIFHGLAVRELAAVAEVSEPVSSEAGDLVVREGDRGDRLYVIMEGDFSVIQSFGTDRPVVLRRIGPGDFFGEMALLDRMPRSATVRSDTKGRLLVLSNEDFAAIILDYPAIPMSICGVLSRRLREKADHRSSSHESPPPRRSGLDRNPFHLRVRKPERSGRV